MNAVIIEDETAAALNLKALLAADFPDTRVVATLESIADTVEWFGANAAPDIVFMDIHLADGNAFKIFDRISIACPIIFTTAYDRYALDAFRVNSIDYLLKPIKEADLKRAIDKLRRLGGVERSAYTERVQQMVERQNCKSFLVQVKDRIIPLCTDEIAFFHTSDEKVVATTVEAKSYPVDRTLETLVTELSADDFFRANRQFIIARRAVKDISVWFGSRLCVNLTVDTPERIIISKARVGEFKTWLIGK